MKEIVAAKLGTVISRSPRQIGDWVQSNQHPEFLERRRFQFMAALDLGSRWKEFAEAPTLFCVDDKGGLHAPGEKT